VGLKSLAIAETLFATGRPDAVNRLRLDFAAPAGKGA
jgi:hypothetical protein